MSLSDKILESKDMTIEKRYLILLAETKNSLKYVLNELEKSTISYPVKVIVTEMLKEAFGEELLK